MATKENEWDVVYKIQMKKIDIISRLIELRLKQLEKMMGKDEYDEYEDQLIKQMDLFNDIAYILFYICTP